MRALGWPAPCCCCRHVLLTHQPRLSLTPPALDAIPPPQVLVFVNSAEDGMRVRLFLEAFGVRAALLNAELPLNSRHHILQVGGPSSAQCFLC